MQADAMPDRGNVGQTARQEIELSAVGLRVDKTKILSGIDLAIGAGAPTILLGPNGSGKTSLLRLMMGLAAPSEGRIEVRRREDGSLARRAFVFQKPVMLKRTAAANVAFALEAAGLASDPAQVVSLLHRVGLAALGTRAARQLSGGEQQRLALARALAREPDLLLLDEPTASLDPAQTNIVEAIIAATASSGVKVVMATHDLGQARRIAGDVVLLVGGRVVEQTQAAQFFRQPMTEQARRFVAGDLVL